MSSPILLLEPIERLVVVGLEEPILISRYPRIPKSSHHGAVAQKASPLISPSRTRRAASSRLRHALPSYLLPSMPAE